MRVRASECMRLEGALDGSLVHGPCQARDSPDGRTVKGRRARHGMRTSELGPHALQRRTERWRGRVRACVRSIGMGETALRSRTRALPVIRLVVAAARAIAAVLAIEDGFEGDAAQHGAAAGSQVVVPNAGGEALPVTVCAGSLVLCVVRGSTHVPERPVEEHAEAFADIPTRSWVRS